MSQIFRLMKADLLRAKIRLELARADLSNERNGMDKRDHQDGDGPLRERNDVPLARRERLR